MHVDELIKELSQYDKDMDVCFTLSGCSAKFSVESIRLAGKTPLLETLDGAEFDDLVGMAKVLRKTETGKNREDLDDFLYDKADRFETRKVMIKEGLM